MSESTVLAAVAARVRALTLADEVYAGRPDPLPPVRRKPLCVVARDDSGATSDPLTLRYDRVRYTVVIRAILGTPRTAGTVAAARLALLAPALGPAAWTADPTLGGTCVEARYSGDSSNLTTYRAIPAPPEVLVRLAVQEWVRRG